MAFQYEGATEGLSDKQFKFIGEVLERRGIKKQKVRVEGVGAVGDNYMANVKRFIVEDTDGKPFKIVAKVAPKNETLRAGYNTKLLFYNEHLMYIDVLRKLKQMQIAAGVPTEEIFTFAECYGSYTEEPDEIILLEDLKESGYIMLDRFKPLSDDCMRSILRNLAILHSFSFVLKNKNPEKYNNIRLQFYDPWLLFGNDEGIRIDFDLLETKALEMLSDNDKRVRVVKGIILGLNKNIKKLLNQDIGSKHAVIQQGDAWSNNVLFKYDGDKLVGSIMIDYQVSREAIPVCDILYSIFNCTDYYMREKHMHDWIDYYHTELDKALSNFGLKANYIYPKDQLDVDLKRYARILCAVCIVSSNILTMSTESATISKNKMENGDFTAFIQDNNAAELKEKVAGLVDTCIDFGWL